MTPDDGAMVNTPASYFIGRAMFGRAEQLLCSQEG